MSLAGGGKWRLAAARLTVLELPTVLLLLPVFLFLPKYWWLGGLVILALWLVHWLGTGRALSSSPANLSVAILLLMIPVTLWVTAFPDLTRQQVGYLVGGVGVYAAILNWTTSERRLQALLLGLMGGLLLVAVASLVVLDPTGAQQTMVPAAILSLGQRLPERVNPNVLAGNLALWVPAALSLAVLPLGQGRARMALRLMASLAVAAGLLALLLLQTRGAWLALAVTVLMVVAVQRRRLSMLVLATFVLALLVLSQARLAEWAGALFQQGPLGGLDVRAEIWLRGYLLLCGVPFTGGGMGTWAQVGPLLYPYVRVPVGIEVPHVHNVLLQVGVDLGVPGLVAYLSLLGLSLWMAVAAYRSFVLVRRLELAWLALATFAGQVVLLLHGLVDAVTWGTKPAVLAWALLGLTAVLFLMVKWAKEGQTASAC